MHSSSEIGGIVHDRTI